MIDLLEIVKDAQGRYLETLTTSQDAVLKAVKNSVNLVEGYIPDLTFLPAAQFLPHPKELATNGFDFARKLIDTNKKFATKLIDATAPVLNAVYGANGVNGKAA